MSLPDRFMYVCDDCGAEHPQLWAIEHDGACGSSPDWHIEIVPRPAPTSETPIEACEREGHLPTVGLRHDLMRLALVADCTRCGAVLMLEQRPAPISENEE